MADIPTPVISVSRGWYTLDNLNRLTSISSTPTGGSAISFDYTYNLANQREKVTLASGQGWPYAYDDLGQLISGRKCSDPNDPNTVLSDRQFDYAFDTIGNRSQTVTNPGGTLFTADYTRNLLNQYTARDKQNGTESFTHDLDGNLTQDDLWNHFYDGENG